MKYTIAIACDNAAFEEDPGTEVARILHKLAERCEREGLESFRLMDINGNHVGDALCVRKAEDRGYYEITAGDVGRAVIQFNGRPWRVSSFMGQILQRDIGKRVFERDGILQVENDEQCAKRRGNKS